MGEKYTAPSSRKKSSLTGYTLVVAASIMLSIGGFLYGALHEPGTDGGRGGALAVVVAFFALFVRSNSALRAFDTWSHVLPEIEEQVIKERGELAGAPIDDKISQTTKDLRNTMNGILASINASSREQLKQSFCIALAGSIGTLAWGFGDKAAIYTKCHWLTSICNHFSSLCRVLG